MTLITKTPTGVEPLIAPGFNPGIRDDYEVLANPKGVEHPQIKQILSLVVPTILKMFGKGMTIGLRHSESEVLSQQLYGRKISKKNETLRYSQGDERFCHWYSR